MNTGTHENVLILSNVNVNGTLLNLQKLSQSPMIVQHVRELSLHVRKYSTFGTSSTYLGLLFSFFVYTSCRCVVEGVDVPCVPANVSRAVQQIERKEKGLKNTVQDTMIKHTGVDCQKSEDRSP